MNYYSFGYLWYFVLYQCDGTRYITIAFSFWLLLGAVYQISKMVHEPIVLKFPLEMLVIEITVCWGIYVSTYCNCIQSCIYFTTFFWFRIFGHFEKPLFLNLVKHMESKILKCGEYLFRIGDLDDSIYVIQEGHINVTICEPVSWPKKATETHTGTDNDQFHWYIKHTYFTLYVILLIFWNIEFSILWFFFCRMAQIT